MIRFDHTSTEYIDDKTIAEAAQKILEDIPEGMSLAKLGQQLSRKFEFPLRHVLGSRKLSPVLRREIGSALEFGGTSGSETVRLVTTDHLARKIRFDPAVWAAFAKPIKANCLRWMSVEKPLTFDDIDESSAPPENRLQILASSIPDEALPHDERDRQVGESILAWCTENGLSPIDFSHSAKERLKPEISQNSRTFQPPHKGTAALIALVAAIPLEERANYSIPLNLIGRLLS
jgi:hypothetical protein